MFGRKKKAQKREEHQQSLRKGLLFWLPGGSSRLDVYVDYCVIRCLGKTKMKEKERVIHLYYICKDMDGLDRVRFNGLDYRMLRTAYAKRLPLVAGCLLEEDILAALDMERPES